MTLLEWKDEYSVGVASIDHEHKELIALINDIYRRMREPVNVVSIDNCLGEICANIAAHFALEERLMRRAQYDEYEAHKKDHEELLDEFHDFLARFFQDSESGRELLQNRLSDWFGNHFATFDARLHKRLDA